MDCSNLCGSNGAVNCPISSRQRLDARLKYCEEKPNRGSRLFFLFALRFFFPIISTDCCLAGWNWWQKPWMQNHWRMKWCGLSLLAMWFWSVSGCFLSELKGPVSYSRLPLFYSRRLQPGRHLQPLPLSYQDVLALGYSLRPLGGDEAGCCKIVALAGSPCSRIQIDDLALESTT